LVATVPYSFSASPLPPAVRERVVGSSWHEGCPVALADLRYLRIRYRRFDGSSRRGEMVVNADAAPAVRRSFARLYRRNFPIRRMRLVDAYGASDFRSIEADNTSSFNCRPATGSAHWSEHAYGRAIDLDPLENPYVSGGATSHPASRPYVDRERVRDRPGVISEGGVVTRIFDRLGWGWGGRWGGTRDYQHLSVSGR
jgi:hypothetical protein